MVDINIILHRYQNEQAYQKAYDSVLQALFECVRDKEGDFPVDKIHLGELALQIKSFQEKYGLFVFIDGLCTFENTKYSPPTSPKQTEAIAESSSRLGLIATRTDRSNTEKDIDVKVERKAIGKTLDAIKKKAFANAKLLARKVLAEGSKIDDSFWQDVWTGVSDRARKSTKAGAGMSRSSSNVSSQYGTDLDKREKTYKKFEEAKGNDVAATRISFSGALKSDVIRPFTPQEVLALRERVQGIDEKLKAVISYFDEHASGEDWEFINTLDSLRDRLPLEQEINTANLAGWLSSVKSHEPAIQKIFDNIFLASNPAVSKAFDSYNAELTKFTTLDELNKSNHPQLLMRYTEILEAARASGEAGAIWANRDDYKKLLSKLTDTSAQFTAEEFAKLSPGAFKESLLETLRATDDSRYGQLQRLENSINNLDRCLRVFSLVDIPFEFNLSQPGVFDSINRYWVAPEGKHIIPPEDNDGLNALEKDTRRRGVQSLCSGPTPEQSAILQTAYSQNFLYVGKALFNESIIQSMGVTGLGVLSVDVDFAAIIYTSENNEKPLRAKVVWHGFSLLDIAVNTNEIVHTFPGALAAEYLITEKGFILIKMGATDKDLLDIVSGKPFNFSQFLPDSDFKKLTNALKSAVELESLSTEALTKIRLHLNELKTRPTIAGNSYSPPPGAFKSTEDFEKAKQLLLLVSKPVQFLKELRISKTKSRKDIEAKNNELKQLLILHKDNLEVGEFLVKNFFIPVEQRDRKFVDLTQAYSGQMSFEKAYRSYIYDDKLILTNRKESLSFIINSLINNTLPLTKDLLFKDNAELHQLLVLIGDDSKLMSRFIKLFIKQDKYNTATPKGPDLIGFLNTVLGKSEITEKPVIEAGASEEKNARNYILRNYFSDPQFRIDINDYLLDSKAIDRLKDGEIVNLAKLDKSTSTAYVLLTGPYLRSGLSSFMASRYSSATINVGRISFSLPKLTTLHRLKKVSPDTFNNLFETYQVNFKKNYGEKATYAADIIAEAQRVYSSPGLKHLNHDQLIATAQGDASGELAKILLTGSHRGVGNKITGADIPVLLEAYFASCAKEVDPVKREQATNIKYQAIRDYFVEPKGLFVDFDNKQLVAAAQGDTSGEIARILLTSSRRSVIGKKITGAEIPALLEAYFANCIKAKDPAKPTPAEIAQQQTDEQAKYKDIEKNFTQPTSWFGRLNAWLRGDNRVAELNNYLLGTDIELTTRQHNLLLNGVLEESVTGIDRNLVQLRGPKKPGGPSSSDAGSAANRPIAGSVTATKEISASTRVGADSGRKLSRSSGSDSESPRGSHSVDNSPQTLKKLFVTVYFKTIGNTDDKLKSKIDLLQRLAISQIKFTELHEYAHSQNRDWIAPETTFNADKTLAEIISHAKESSNADPDLIANIVETSNDNDDDTPKKLNAKTVQSLKHASNDMLAAVYLHESVGSNMQFVKNGILSNSELCVKLLSTENKAQAKALMTNDNNVTALVNMYEAVSDVNLQAELKQLLIQLNRTAAKENKFHEGFKPVFGFGGQFIYEDKTGKILQTTAIDKNKPLEVVAEQHTPPTIKT